MKFQCKKCGTKDEIKFRIEGIVISMDLRFDCQKCRTNLFAHVIFNPKEQNKPKIKLEYEDDDYIG